MRLKAEIIAILLAFVMALAPFAMPRAMAHEGHRSAPAAIAVEGHEAKAGHAHAHQVGRALAGRGAACHAVPTACGDAHGDRYDGAQGCCGMGLCHAFQVSPALSLASPSASSTVRLLPRDEQVESSARGGLDRPPRTA
ncbi:hypothetical protein [Alsobacter sp. SYSU BS001988]